MHISLDSALGRQRRLNQVGESITQIAPDPAAAYSLRSLTGSDPKVVRVRRESDNHEQDFTASEVSSGALVDFVNTQVTAPLDIQALTATGRDGDFLIAKAAYSLRSLGTRQATVAATGDTVARADGKYVCQVRRNVNGDLKSFTADEVTDGTLVSFVNESFTSSLPLDVQGSAAAAYSLRNLSSSYSGNVVEVRRSSDDTTQNFTADEVTNGTLLAFVGTGGSDNGFVKTWYDQSGSTNHATQTDTAKQPKIVDAGSLVERNSKPSLKFSSSNLSKLDFAKAQPNTAFCVGETVETGTDFQPFIDGSEASVSTSGRNQIGVRLSSNQWQMFAGTAYRPFSYAAGLHLAGGLFNGTSSRMYLDGSESAEGDVGTQQFGDLRIGSQGGTVTLNGFMSEVIIYDTDQTDKRRAIEESIATNYGITLASFNRDGFVKTWYDQSVTNQAGDTATGNHATQSTAASQPKIVDAGALNTSGGLEFDSTDDFFALTNTVSFENLPLAMFSVQDSQPNHNHHTLGCDDSRGIGISGSTTQYFFTGSSATLTFSSSVTGLNLYSVLHDGTTNSDNITANRNGVANSSSSGSGMSQANSSSQWKNIGVRANTNDFFHGTIKEIIVYNTDQTDNRTAIEANIGEHYSISGIPAFDNSVNGFVETWYDQSGNGLDAVQATASKQPLIVESGSLNVDSFSNPTIRFEKDSETHLITTDSTLDPNLEVSAFVVQKDEQVENLNSGWVSMRRSDSSGRRSAFEMGVNNNSIKFRLIYDPGVDNTNKTDTEVTVASDGLGTTSIMSSIKTSSGDLDGFFNGSSVIDTTVTDNTDLGSGYGITMGKHSNTGQFADGRLNEVIFYLSDQTANRSAIETNLANHYGITLL